MSKGTIKKIFTLPTIFITISAMAEYRAYEYVIANKINDSSDIQSQTIRTSLNPRAYLAYHGGNELISITLRRTWMCPGNTAYKPICPSPYELMLAPNNENTNQGAE